MTLAITLGEDAQGMNRPLTIRQKTHRCHQKKPIHKTAKAYVG
jgi:hypothetical protein